jgi:hypothetical protein
MRSLEVDFALFIRFRRVDNIRSQALSFLLLLFGFGFCKFGRDAFK